MISFKNFLLLELNTHEVEERFESKKFKKTFAFDKQKPAEGENLHLKMLNKTKKSILNLINKLDVTEKNKANALNWLISMIISDPRAIIILNTKTSTSPIREFLELFYQIKEQKLNRFLPKSSIEQYSTISEFLTTIGQRVRPAYLEYLEAQIEKSTKNEEGRLKVWENDAWEIYLPLTKGAACALGKGTDWCTAAPGLNYYEHYKKSGQLVIFISKINTNPEEKYQFHYGERQFMDIRDRPVTGLTFFVLHEIFKRFVLPNYSNKFNASEKSNIKNIKSEAKFIGDDHIIIVDRNKIGQRDTIEIDSFNLNTMDYSNPNSPIVSAEIDRGGFRQAVRVTIPAGTNKPKKTIKIIKNNIENRKELKISYGSTSNFLGAYINYYLDSDGKINVEKVIGSQKEGKGRYKHKIIDKFPDMSRYLNIDLNKY